MNTLSNRQHRGISRQGMRSWGLLFILAGSVGTAAVQNVLLAGDPENLTLMTVAIVLQLVMACAIPVFTFLLVDGFEKTSDALRYGFRVFGASLLSEIPYNLTVSGEWLNWNSRNPLFAMVLAMVLLYAFGRYPGFTVKNLLIKVAVFFLALVWVNMLCVQDGVAVLIMTSVLWGLRRNRVWQVFGGCATMFLCSVLSPYYLLAPIIFLIVHFYNDEQGEENRWFNYLSYPVMLLIVGLIAKYAL